MDEQDCGNCRFWLRHPDGERVGPDDQDYMVGTCRRYPPVVLSGGDSGDYFARPEMVDDQWCGEWRSTEAPSADETARLLALAVLNGGGVEPARALADRLTELGGKS